jgi:hypothetical protein
MRKWGIAWGIAVLAIVSGCAGAGAVTAKPLTDGTTFRFDKATPAQVQQAARDALAECGFGPGQEGADGDTWWILADLGASMASWGQWARIAVKPGTKAGADVWIVNERKGSLNATEDLDTVRRRLRFTMTSSLLEIEEAGED